MPLVLAGVPGNLGNPEFKLGVFNAVGGAPVTLGISTAFAFSQINGVNVNIDLTASPLFIPGVLNGAAGVPGDGYGTFNLALPYEPALTGLNLFAQWFIWDAGAPNGAASTRSGRVVLF